MVLFYINSGLVLHWKYFLIYLAKVPYYSHNTHVHILMVWGLRKVQNITKILRRPPKQYLRRHHRGLVPYVEDHCF